MTTSVPVVGAWGWLPDEGGGSRVDYRPKEYWPANTQVTVKADLYGVAYGGGSVGDGVGLGVACTGWNEAITPSRPKRGCRWRWRCC